MTVPERSEPAPEKKPGALWRTVKAVGWGFFGVRKNSEYQEDIARLSPLQIVAVGFVAVLVFIGLLVVLVKLAVAV